MKEIADRMADLFRIIVVVIADINCAITLEDDVGTALIERSYRDKIVLKIRYA